MYEQSGSWNLYYRETDPKIRARMLPELLADEPDDGAGPYRLLLFKARHEDPEDPEKEIDRYLWNCVNFAQIYRSSRFFKKNAGKEVRKAMAEMELPQAASKDPGKELAAYWEIRNAAARYLRTCSDSGYRRTLFGMMSSGEADRADQICKDIWEMTTGLALRLGLEEELWLWIRAVQDQYCSAFPDGQSRLLAYGKK